MNTPTPFTCFITGEGSLPIQCAEILRQKGHDICGIISADGTLKQWAEENALLYHKSAELAEALNRRPFDYLFSIANPQILKSEVLALPRRAAINYHDGPLPRYAGSQAPSWALINRETTHAITWHLMTERVDAGDILKQVPVAIRPEETALTLNAKCYQAALEAFAELVDELAMGKAPARAQEAAQRTFFGRYQKPPAACIISWQAEAAALDALVRALDFGTYANPIGRAKIWVGEQVWVLAETAVGQPTSAPPGTITGITSHGLHVAARTRALVCRRFATLDGQQVTVAQVVEQSRLATGHRLPLLDETMAERVTAVNAALAPHEPDWRSRLADLQPVALPYAAKTGGEQAVYGRLVSDDPLPGTLSALGPAAAVLAAAFVAYLARLNGRYRFDTGYTGPAQQALADLQNLFATQVPLRIDLDPAWTWQQVLATVTKAIETSQKQRSFSHDVWGRYPELRDAQKSTGEYTLPVAVAQVENPDAYQLRPGCGLALLPAENGRYHIVYDATRTTAENAARIQVQFETFLHNIAAHPQWRLAQWQLLPAEERHRVVVAWNQTAVEYGETRPVHALFAAQAARTPQATALVFAGGEMSYEELNGRANQLAHYLQKQGVGPESIVGIYMQRSLEMVMAIYGILKAGGAYLPLDPGYPQSRLAAMLADSQTNVVLTQQHLLPLPPHLQAALPDLTLLPLDSAWSTLAGESRQNPHSDIDDDNLAYVIYTSGSTGRPKGVMNVHGAIRNRILWMQAQYGLHAGDRVLQKTPFSFDVSVWEFLWPLLVGARLVIARPEGHKDSNYLVETIVAQQITTIHFVPSMLQLFLQAKEVAACNSLRRVICSGEALSYDLQERFFAQLDAELHNLYGPTEAAIDVSYWRCRRHSPRRMVPIGRPIANTQLYILDQHLHPVPVGAAGELHIGGSNLARGYLNRPALTAEKFIPNPFLNNERKNAPEPSLIKQPQAARHSSLFLYKTGDVARFLADGNIEYLGRTDFQVKVRGFRIELGEVEAALARHTAVAGVVVTARPDHAGQQRLVAYLVGGGEAKTAALQAYLQEQLPDYMVPAAFVFLPALPLTPSGKVNRRALPEPDSGRPPLSTPYVAPRTALEKQLVALWQAVLNVEPVGMDDNFFELGGDSIQGAVLINRLQEKLDLYLYIVALFEAPTVAQFAAYLQQHYLEAAAPHRGGATAGRRIGTADVHRLRNIIPTLPPHPEDEDGAPNPTAVFILAPPRSGSTLLRVMLGGHPRLFAPPELDLLSFNTLGERRAAFAGAAALRLEGTIRALMALHESDAAQARERMAQYERKDMGTRQFFRLLQERAGQRMVVDKTPSYALDTHILQRMERDFKDARYIHLLRHPYGMVHSFERVRLDQTFFLHPHPFTVRQLAELLWLVSHQNILQFLQTVPGQRRRVVRFEDLVTQPTAVMAAVCGFLGLEWHPDTVQPYKNPGQRMADGLYEQSRMLGDVRFHEHDAIDPGVAEVWRQAIAEDFLGDITWQVAESLGYERLSSPVKTAVSPTPSSANSQNVPQTFPLSFGQQRLWFLEQFEPGSAVYNIPHTVRMEGTLHGGALQQALAALVARHDTLRTTFTMEAGEPLQVVAPTGAISLRQIDLRALTPEQQTAASGRLTLQEAQKPFDLRQGPLLRTTLLRLNERENILLLTMHHIVSDGWSMGILTRELAQLYEAFVAGKPSPLPPLAIQYSDFVQWQRAWLQRERLAEQLSYWQEQLKGLPQLLPLPTNHPRPPLQTFAGATYTVTLPPSLVAAARALGRREGVTLFMTLLAAFKVLLYRYSNQPDISVGTPTANRNRREIEGAIGLFANTLVLRTDLSGNPSFRQLLPRIRETALGAYGHQDMPFEQLVEALQPARSLSHHPLFQVMFILQNAPSPDLVLHGLTMTPLPVDSGTAKFDLTLSLRETAATLTATFEYNTDLFEAATIARMAGHFQVLLQAIGEDPDQPVLQLPLLTTAERQQLLVAWNETATDFPAVSLHQPFEQQAAKRPHAIAAGYQDQHLTYRQLNRRANQLAHFLQKQGVGPETIVGVYLQRSLEMLVALLGILKAGGAYLPLDPAFPQERLAYMLADSQARLLISKQTLPPLPGSHLPTLHIDAGWPAIAEESVASPPCRATPGNLAYLIYTSGSTGKPKGVQVLQRGVANFLASMRREPGLAPDDVLLSVTTLSFDIAVLELFLPLWVGARVVIAGESVVADGRQLATALKTTEATVMQATPATWQLLLEAGWEKGQSLKKILCGGEALPRRLAGKLLARSRSLWNMYGPTETTIWSAIYKVESSAHAVPIGRPIANTQLYILDDALQPVPTGLPGNLYIGGAGLARGYFNRPVLTAEAFVPNPFLNDGLRMTNDERKNVPDSSLFLYRTGDMARFLTDGNVVFLGRNDNQVKVRGFRIELGEIEAALAQHTAVDQCVVVVREDTPGEKRLVAYLVSSGEMPATAAWRRFLQQKLPAYMIPAVFVALDAFPLTPNGKIDRRALPAPEQERPELAAAFVAPRDRLERQLVQIWEALLGVQPIGIEDNFFDLGGHSLLAMRLMSQIEAHLGQALPLVTLFQGATVAQLAVVLRQKANFS